MKTGFVSAVAVLFCCAVVAVVGVFGYSRYKAAQASNAAFGQQLQKPGQPMQLGAHMPDQLPAHSAPGGSPHPPGQ
ncbi:MAG TPA: hypothetical protein VHY22_05675 [Chthoniobacteraceae bacterium]|jgi:predicted negative regulator of RcsB-dependent stress response|nr:hypothetical protein [Chthoniobacteraceae bacterium]